MARLDRRISLIALVVAACGTAPYKPPPQRPWPREGRCINASYMKTPEDCISISAADAEAIRDAILAYVDARRTADPGLAGARTIADHPLADGTIGGYFIEAYRDDGLEILRLTGVTDSSGSHEHGFRVRVVRGLDEPWRVERVEAYSDALPQPNA